MYNIRIKQLPKNGDQRNYSLVDRNDLYIKVNPINQDSNVKNTISAVPREEANIEAEGGETVIGDINNDGYLEHSKIVGKRHTGGGVPLNVAPGSFIFSDTKKLKIKDPEVLSIFGITNIPAGGITPAKIANRYPMNNYMNILKDDDYDAISKRTASKMLENNLEKLGMLALIQEAMKGFPDGIPAIAESVMAGLQGQQASGQEQGAPEEMMEGQEAAEEGQMRYGGSAYYQRAGTIKEPQTKKLPGKKKVAKEKPYIPTNTYKVGPDTSTGYWDRVGENWSSVDFKKSLNNPDDDPRMKQALKKLIPFNGSSGVLDYAANMFTLPQKGINSLLTGYYESPMDTKSRYSPVSDTQHFWGDVATDPMIYPELPVALGKGAVKVTGKAIQKAAPYVAEVAELTAKYGKQAAQFLSQYIGKMPFEQLLSKGSMIVSRIGQAGLHASSDNNENEVKPRVKSVYVPTPIDTSRTPQERNVRTIVKENAPAVRQPQVVVAPAPVVTNVAKPVVSKVSVKTAAQSTNPNSNIIYTDEEFADGGLYLPKHQGTQPGVPSTVQGPGKTVVGYEYSNKTGNKRPVYSDGTKGQVILYDVEDADLTKTVQDKGYNFSYLPEELRYKEKTVGPQTSKTGYKLDPESGFLYKDIKPGTRGLDEYMKIHADAINAYPGGADKWRQDQIAGKGKANPAMTHLLEYENAAIGTVSGNKPYIDMGIEGALVPGVENYNLPGISKKPAPVVKTTPAAEQEFDIPVMENQMGPQERKPWWLQDQVYFAGKMTDDARKYGPGLAKVNLETPGYVLEDPARQIAAIQEDAAATREGAYNSTAGNVAGASVVGQSNQRLGQLANVIGAVENRNVNTVNQALPRNAQIINQERVLNANAQQKYLAESATANQQYDNARRDLKWGVIDAFNNGTTNMQRTNQLESMFPQYEFDRMSGNVAFTKGRQAYDKYGRPVYDPYQNPFDPNDTSSGNGYMTGAQMAAMKKDYIDNGMNAVDAQEAVMRQLGRSSSGAGSSQRANMRNIVASGQAMPQRIGKYGGYMKKYGGTVVDFGALPLYFFED
jgi:hypothetical protein